MAAGADPLAPDGAGHLPQHHLRASSGAVLPLADAVAKRWRKQQAALGEARAERAALDSCTICLAARRDSVLLPCGHFAFCAACATRLVDMEESCPLCRERPVDTQTIYLS